MFRVGDVVQFRKESIGKDLPFLKLDGNQYYDCSFDWRDMKNCLLKNKSTKDFFTVSKQRMDEAREDNLPAVYFNNKLDRCYPEEYFEYYNKNYLLFNQILNNI